MTIAHKRPLITMRFPGRFLNYSLQEGVARLQLLTPLGNFFLIKFPMEARLMLSHILNQAVIKIFRRIVAE